MTVGAVSATDRRMPVFVNSYPRVGSTWFGAKLMEWLGDRHFHEPLHPILLDATHQSAEADFERLRRGKSLRHPPRERNYFFNYPLGKNGGVQGFDERFCFGNFVLDPDERDPDFKAYWKGLLKYARSNGRQFSFKDTSTPLRQGWLKANLSGMHIYLVQHPRLTDKSYFSFRGFNNPYIREYALIVGLNRDHHGLGGLFNWMAIEPPCTGQSVNDGIAHYSKLFSAPKEKRDPRFTRQFHYNVLCFFWMAGLAHASRHADVIVDLEVLRDDARRSTIEAEIKEKTGLALDLSDYRPRVSKHTVGPENFRLMPGMIEVIRQSLPHFDPDWQRLKTVLLSDATARAVGYFGHGTRLSKAAATELFATMPPPMR